MNIDGKQIAQDIKNRLKDEVLSLKEKSIITGLAVVLIGENSASKIYVKSKKKACEKTGIKSFEFKLSENTTQKELEDLITKLNNDNNVHGILVQLPLPSHINEQKIIELIDPKKDVDGFHPNNMGNLFIGLPCFKPCTPLGIMKLFDSINYDLKGKNAVVLGRSKIVGKPIAMLLLERDCTVTICHSKTENLAQIISNADILIAAIGKPEFVKGDWIKKDSVVIDVGINRTENGIKGDVEFDPALKKAFAITPVPGGVGPMTIAMLLQNTIKAAKNRL